MHLKNDLNLIASSLNMNLNDAFSLIHLILAKILNTKTIKANDRYNLNTKEDRNRWEVEFCETFVNSIIQVKQMQIIFKLQFKKLSKIIFFQT